MDKRKVNKAISEQKEKLTIELLYLRNKHKGIDKEFIQFLFLQKQEEAIKLLNSAKNKQDLQNLFRKNYKSLETRFGTIFECLLTGEIYGSFEASLNTIPMNIADRFVSHHYTKSDLKTILEVYSESLINYINNHNIIKHELLKKENINNNLITDFRNNITEEDYKEICSLLFKNTTYHEHYHKNEMSKIIIFLLSIYDRNTLKENIDFVKYEIEYGYFDEYCKLLEAGKEIPSLDERLKQFATERNITSNQRYRLSQIDLLENRVSSLSSNSKYLILEKIALIKKEPDIVKKASLVDECFDYYEKKYRQEIVDSLYSPTSSTEITDFRELDAVMLHIFLRDPMKKLSQYEESLKEEIISSRGVKVTGSEELTEEEKELFQSKVDYAINVLLNPVITSESLDSESLYSDSTGFRWYKSNTSNQISASLFSIDTLTNLGNCIGVGFDKTSISPDNIIISSKYYQTTNMGVDNLEVEPANRFNSFSSSLTELKKSSKTELVMYRKNGDIKTNAAYVFAIINGRNAEKDKETIMQAKEYAEKNNIKLIVFNNMKIKKSYNEFLSQQLPEETPSEDVKKL